MIATQTKFGTKHIVIVILTLVTSLVHFYLFISMGVQIQNIPFLLNSLGYLTLLAAYFLPIPLAQRYHGVIRWLFMGFAAVTILAWLAIGDHSIPAGLLGYVTKLIEIILIVLLWTDKPK